MNVNMRVNIHPDDQPMIDWALANGWSFLSSPQGIPLITRKGLYLAFAVEPRITEAGRTIIGQEMQAALAKAVG